MYNPNSQYRCTIIRGKSISKMDDYLPIYAEILNEICPIQIKLFAKYFDRKLSECIKDDAKTIKNHRTENVTKLLGLVFEKDGIVYLSKRTIKYIKDNDQPALFKSVCFQFQQPNGSQKIATIIDKVQHMVCFKPYHFILYLLYLADKNDIVLTKNEIGYYVLNSLDVLQNKISAEEVLTRIKLDRKNGMTKKVPNTKNYAWDYQHINEQFDYLKLANLIRDDGANIMINSKEEICIKYFIDDLNNPLAIDYFKYDFEEKNIGKKIEREWQEYFGNNDRIELIKFNTSIKYLDVKSSEEKRILANTKSTIGLGDEGEKFVYEFEKNVVKKFNPRLVNKVIYQGKTKGLGYDIISIEANRNQENPEYSRYIEVKATTRVSLPKFVDTYDTINLTRNEWVAAKQQNIHFYIYRIYFTNSGIYISIINDPVKKKDEQVLYAAPTNYRVEFSDKAVDERINFDVNGEKL